MSETEEADAEFWRRSQMRIICRLEDVAEILFRSMVTRCRELRLPEVRQNPDRQKQVRAGLMEDLQAAEQFLELIRGAKQKYWELVSSQ